MPVMRWSSAASCMVTPITFRAPAGSATTSTPATFAVPAVGGVRVVSTRTVVVLPEPLRPR